jgi:hypothetical protein
VVNSGESAGDDLLDNALEDLGLNLGDAYYDNEEDLDIDWDEGEPPFCAGSRLNWGESCRGRSSCHVELAGFPVIICPRILSRLDINPVTATQFNVCQPAFYDTKQECLSYSDKESATDGGQ